MILNPLQNSPVLLGGNWLQKRPRVTQLFGKNPDIYAQFGLDGHNGLDYGVVVGTQLYAPFEGFVHKVGDDGVGGYGKHIKLRKDNLEVVLAHLSEVNVKSRDVVHLGDKIAKTGNTGFSTGPHLHFGLRFLNSNGGVVNYDNGFKGYVDPIEYLLTWKGTMLNPEF